MAEKQIKWNNTSKRFVAFIDIMGFKDIVFRSTHIEVQKMLESFQPAIEMIEYHAREVLVGNIKKMGEEENIMDKSVIRPVLFSDSIILFSSDDSLSSVLNMFFTIGWVFEHAVRNSIPIKGAIAYGEQTADFDRSLHFGRPLIDAFDLQDELLLYGIVLHHTMERRLKEDGMMKKFENFWILRWPTPMKSGNITHYILDWITRPWIDEKVRDLLPQLYCVTSGSPRRYVDNTIELVNWLVKRQQS